MTEKVRVCATTLFLRSMSPVSHIDFSADNRREVEPHPIEPLAGGSSLIAGVLGQPMILLSMPCQGGCDNGLYEFILLGLSHLICLSSAATHLSATPLRMPSRPQQPLPIVSPYRLDPHASNIP